MCTLAACSSGHLQELIEFRVRSIPITVCVNLYDGEVRQLEVNVNVLTKKPCN